MPTFIPTLDDPRLAPYRNLKDRQLAGSDRFLAEGEHLVRRLLGSQLQTESVLLAQRRVEQFSSIIPPSVPLYIVPDERIHDIIGFRFHSGVIAVGRRPVPPTLPETLPSTGSPALIVVVPELISAENLGGIIRLSAGFGADALVLGPRCIDPFYRLSVRVSMGTVFTLPIVRSANLLSDLSLLRDRAIQSFATVLEPDAPPLHDTPRAARVAVVLGNEAQGLSAREIAACDHRVTIPMQRGTDSLNVTTAAAIFLHHFAARQADGF